MSIAKQATGLLIQTQAETITRTNTYAILTALVAGIFILSAVGLAGPDFLHNATHDIRHGLTFPCH